MNTSPIIPVVVAADLSSYSDVAVKLTSTGVNLAGPGDRAIGTILQGNDYPALGQSAVGMAATVLLSAGHALHNFTIGNNSALVQGDELEVWPSGRYGKRGGTLTGTGQVTGDTITVTNHGLTNGTSIVFTTLTTGSGLSTGTTYFVIGATANTFQVALTSGGSAVDITTADYTVATFRLAGSTPVAGLAFEAAPASNAGGVIRGILFNTTISSTTQVLKAATTLANTDSGKTFFLDLAAGFAVTLPAVATAAGSRLTFIVSTAPSGGSYTIVGASGTPIHGMALSKDLNGATDTAATAGTGVLTITLVDSKATKGDIAELICDGTSWFASIRTGGNFDAVTLS
jgi:hypothetical protein